MRTAIALLAEAGFSKALRGVSGEIRADHPVRQLRRQVAFVRIVAFDLELRARRILLARLDDMLEQCLSLPIPFWHREPVATLGLDADQCFEVGPAYSRHSLVFPVLGDAGTALAQDMPFEPRASLGFLLRHGRIKLALCCCGLAMV